ncbi:hypothetical protein ASPFODRAFT_232885 [Aspergillus luchuensis CBS 106.47]|uniref:Uncharacterized protein n=1 Tax=Aspergillus luchuensis (strain CBS 106.47) TaxID=1137211 RepID=A0A1M3TYS4_ASPLC|nr:hypothetical protein ASPFODRAFT_232885 [Aspergillus luchuensis CBS 106.47]
MSGMVSALREQLQGGFAPKLPLPIFLVPFPFNLVLFGGWFHPCSPRWGRLIIHTAELKNEGGNRGRVKGTEPTTDRPVEERIGSSRGRKGGGGGEDHGEPKGKRQDCEAGRKRTHAKPRLSFKKGGKREPQQS